MPATRFICPNGQTILIDQCLEECPYERRCMAKPSIKALSRGVRERGLSKFSVTELLRGTRESYLLKLYNYAVNPQSLAMSAEGTALHNMNEEAVSKDGWVMTEQRFENDIATGQIDAYGYIFNDKELAICDYKYTSSFKIAKALGYGYITKDSTEVYKTGPKKGQPKPVKIWTDQKAKIRFEWALQQNFYRMLLEEAGYKVDAMYIQAYARDCSMSKNMISPLVTIKLNKISDVWIKRWFEAKRARLQQALDNKSLPPVCKQKERWKNDLKCNEFCNVANICKNLQLNSK